MTDSPFDFRKPAAAKDRTAEEWLGAACRLSAKLWTSRWPFSAELKLTQIEAVDPPTFLRTLPESSVGFAIESAHAIGRIALLAVERPLLLALLAGLLGELPIKLPADREFTAVEKSLLEYLMPQLLEPLRTAWPGEPPTLAASAPGSPRAIGKLPASEPALAASLELTGKFGSRPMFLLMPAVNWPATIASDEVRSSGPFDRTEMESALRELPLEFSVTLGRVRLSLGQLLALKAGDVLILEQRVADPLPAQVGGSERFIVWPGAIGASQAVQIHAPRKATA